MLQNLASVTSLLILLQLYLLPLHLLYSLFDFHDLTFLGTFNCLPKYWLLSYLIPSISFVSRLLHSTLLLSDLSDLVPVLIIQILDHFKAEIDWLLCFLFLFKVLILFLSVSLPHQLIPLEEVLVLLFKLNQFLKAWNVHTCLQFVWGDCLQFVKGVWL